MRRSSLGFLLLTLCTLLALVAPVAPASAHSAAALPQPAPRLQSGTAKAAEVVVLTIAGQIRVDTPLPPAGQARFTWDSGSDTGYQNVAVGHFDSDGSQHQEIVAVKGGTIRIFQLLPSANVMATLTPPESGNFRQLAVGDFDGDGKDEVAASYAPISSPSIEYVVVYDGGPDGHVWNTPPVRVKNTYFYPQWQDMKAGDIDDDGRADLVMARQSGHLIKAFLGQSGGGFVEVPDYTSASFPYLALAVGRIHLNAADEILASRDGTAGKVYAVLNLRYTSGVIKDITGIDTKFLPEPTSVALGDLNGDGDKEALLLRDPLVNKAALLIRDFDRPTGGTTVPAADLLSSGYYGANAFRTVRAGDLDADGREEIVLLRGDRYQVYGDMTENYALRLDVPGSYLINQYYVPSATSLAVANLNGDGAPAVPSLSVSPATQLNLGTVTFGKASAIGSINIVNSGGSSAINWQASVASDDADWLKVYPANGQTPYDLFVWVDTTHMASGDNFGGLTISTSDPGVTNPSHSISVLATLQGSFAAVPGGVLLWQTQGQPAPVRKVELLTPFNATTTIAWTASAPEPWLTLTPTSGEAGPSTTTHTITVGVDSTKVPGNGLYHTNISVHGGDQTLTIPVTYVLADRKLSIYLPLVSRVAR